MSDVKATDLTPIRGVDDIAHLYLGSGTQAKAGLEVEFNFFNPKGTDLPVMSLAQNRVLKNAAQAALGGDWLHNEPTSEVLEIASIAEKPENLKKILLDVGQKTEILTHKAQGIGLKRSYYQELPERTAGDLLSRIVDVERYNVMYAPYRDDMKECVRYFAVCKSSQVSISYRNQNHGFDNVRRLYCLAPFLFLLTDNSSGFLEGKPFTGQPGMFLRHNGLPQGRGGILPYVFSSRSAEEFFSNHIKHVFKNPLFMYYGLDGKLNRVPSGDWSVTFESLKEHGLNTTSNYYLAQSVLWPDVKIAALKDEEGTVTGHRYEARMFGVGLHQHQTALIITATLAFDNHFAASIDELLERYGFSSSNPAETLRHLQDAYTHARNHNGKFMNIPYGTGNMAEFAREFADLIEPAAENFGLEEEAQPLLDICRSGCTDAKVNRLLFSTLTDIKSFQRSYDPSIFNNPNQSARMLFRHEICRQNKNHAITACCG